jgi:cell division GTPase FtsZ
VIDEGMGDEIRVTLIATGFDKKQESGYGRLQPLRAPARPGRSRARGSTTAAVLARDPRRRDRHPAVPALKNARDRR